MKRSLVWIGRAVGVTVIIGVAAIVMLHSTHHDQHSPHGRDLRRRRRAAARRRLAKKASMGIQQILLSI